MKNLKILVLTICLSTTIGFLSAQAQDTMYAWEGGAPGYHGTIVMDSPSSSGGTFSDIVSISVSTPDGPTIYGIPSTGLDYYGSPITWNSSQITEMYFGMQATVSGYYLVVAENLLAEEGPGGLLETDVSGSWQVISVPEPSVIAFGMVGTVIAVMWYKRLLHYAYTKMKNLKKR